MKGESWKLSDLARSLKNAFAAILKGELLLRLDFGKYFPHILTTFLMMGAVIWISLAIETTMAREQKIKAELEELEIERSQMKFELSKVETRKTVKLNLEKMGSGLREPQERIIVMR